jgi:hypothetical protein
MGVIVFAITPEDQLNQMAQSLVDNKQCAQAMDILTNDNSSENELTAPKTRHLLLLEAQVCTNKIEDKESFLNRLDALEASYHFTGDEKQRITLMRNTLTGEKSNPFNDSKAILLLVVLFILTGLIATKIKRKTKPDPN